MNKPFIIASQATPTPDWTSHTSATSRTDGRTTRQSFPHADTGIQATDFNDADDDYLDDMQEKASVAVVRNRGRYLRSARQSYAH